MAYGGSDRRKRSKIKLTRPKKPKGEAKGTERSTFDYFKWDQIGDALGKGDWKAVLKTIGWLIGIPGLILIGLTLGAWYFAATTWWGLIIGYVLLVLLVVRFVLRPPSLWGLILHVGLILLGFVGAGFFLAKASLNWFQIACWYIGPTGLVAAIWIFGPVYWTGLREALTALWAVLPRIGTALWIKIINLRRN
ncbi:hypothetical protein KJ596_04775 [Patescibacteria group bacterium]|nr:hypothetical protein [Patescibacteria group bacterium]MBU1868463.1 hypothetical protein [Patescibacteria group bacterium]